MPISGILLSLQRAYRWAGWRTSRNSHGWFIDTLSGFCIVTGFVLFLAEQEEIALGSAGRRSQWRSMVATMAASVFIVCLKLAWAPSSDLAPVKHDTINLLSSCY